MKQDKAAAFITQFPIKYLVADRERFLVDGSTIGVMDPIQGVSSKVGPFMFCFDKSSVMLEEHYRDQTRYVFEFEKHVECPPKLTSQFKYMRATAGLVRKFSLPSEY